MGGEGRDLASGAAVDVLVPCDVAGLTAVALDAVVLYRRYVAQPVRP